MTRDRDGFSKIVDNLLPGEAVELSSPSPSATAGVAHASRPAWAVLAGCGITTLALGLASTGRRAQASARRNSERLAAETAAFPTEHRYRRDPQRPD
jgi:hypothetical protein